MAQYAKINNWKGAINHKSNNINISSWATTCLVGLLQQSPPCRCSRSSKMRLAVSVLVLAVLLAPFLGNFCFDPLVPCVITAAVDYGEGVVLITGASAGIGRDTVSNVTLPTLVMILIIHVIPNNLIKIHHRFCHTCYVYVCSIRH